MPRMWSAAETSSERAGGPVNPQGPCQVVADDGDHRKKAVSDLAEARVRTYCTEPECGRQRWSRQRRKQQVVYANRRQMRGERSKRLLRQRGEKLEPLNKHLYDHGGTRRVHLRGRTNILKRRGMQAGPASLGRLMWKMFGTGTPRALHSRLRTALPLVIGVKQALRLPWTPRRPERGWFLQWFVASVRMG